MSAAHCVGDAGHQAVQRALEDNSEDADSDNDERGEKHVLEKGDSTTSGSGCGDPARDGGRDECHCGDEPCVELVHDFLLGGGVRLWNAKDARDQCRTRGLANYRCEIQATKRHVGKHLRGGAPHLHGGNRQRTSVRGPGGQISAAVAL